MGHTEGGVFFHATVSMNICKTGDSLFLGEYPRILSAKQ